MVFFDCREIHAVVGFPKIYFEAGLGSTRRKMKVPNQLIGNKNVVSDSSAADWLPEMISASKRRVRIFDRNDEKIS